VNGHLRHWHKTTQQSMPYLEWACKVPAKPSLIIEARFTRQAKVSECSAGLSSRSITAEWMKYSGLAAARLLHAYTQFLS
jgi:hypothetical protein